MQFEGKESIKRVKPILRSGSIFQEGDFSAETCMLCRKRQCETPPSGGEVSPSCGQKHPAYAGQWFPLAGETRNGGKGVLATRQAKWVLYRCGAFSSLLFVSFLPDWNGGLSRTGSRPPRLCLSYVGWGHFQVAPELCVLHTHTHGGGNGWEAQPTSSWILLLFG